MEELGKQIPDYSAGVCINGVKESVGAVVRPASCVVGFSNSHSVQPVPPHSHGIITPINSDIFTPSDNRDVNSGTP